MITHAVLADRLFSAVDETVREQVLVTIAGDRIHAVEPAAAAAQLPPTVPVVHRPGATLMPGLIDAHTHIHGKGGHDNAFHLMEGTELLGLTTLRAYRNAYDMLQVGYTALRDVASRGYADVAVRQAINSGLLPGPRLLVAGQGISITSGHMDKGVWAPMVSMPGRTGVGDGPWEVRKAVRTQIKHGVDLIKINACGGDVHNWAEPWVEEMTFEEMEAACHEAHKRRLKVAAHVSGGIGVTHAIQAGVDSIEHGSWLTHEQAAMMVERGTYLVPTLIVNTRGVQDGREAAGLDEATWQWCMIVEREKWGAVLRAREAGVRIVAGSDCGFVVYHTEASCEIEQLVKAGLRPTEALQSATSTAADLLGLDCGRIAPGKLADLILVDGDPTQDVSVLQRADNIPWVMVGGTVHKAPGEVRR
jgi:imidazolonepropionase-like amidohydrolase